MDNMAFCEVCGSKTENGICPNCAAQQYNQQFAQPQYGQPQQVQQAPSFVSEDEVFLAGIGNSMGQNFFAGGGMLSTSAVVTNRRIYFKGTALGTSGRGFAKSKISKVIRLEDVTGTGVFTRDYLFLLIFGCIFAFLGIPLAIAFQKGYIAFLGFFLGGMMILTYFLSKTKILKIEYPGGGLSFSIKLISADACETFMRAVHYAKDSMYSQY